MTAEITSLQNRRVKSAIKLRHHRQRQQQGRFLIDGLRELQQAMASSLTIREAYHCPGLAPPPETRHVLQGLQSRGAEILTVAPHVWEKLCFGHRRDGLLAIADTPAGPLSSLDQIPLSLVVVLEGIEKPGNTGAIVRTANGAGAQAVLVADGGSDLYNPNTIRSSLGMLFRTPTLPCTSAEALSYLRRRQLAVYVARLDADANHYQADLVQPCALVLGSEACGVTEVWKQQDMRPLRLPMLGQADSLNVSAAAAVLLYEAVRQRQLAS